MRQREFQSNLSHDEQIRVPTEDRGAKLMRILSVLNRMIMRVGSRSGLGFSEGAGGVKRLGAEPFRVPRLCFTDVGE